MENNWTLHDFVMLGIFIISAISLIYTVISTWAIRGNDLKHIESSIAEMKKVLCDKIKAVEKRIERLENTFIQGE